MRRAALVRRFLQRPHQLATLDARCGRHIPEVHALGKVHATVGQTDRSLASMALNAAGDAATRWDYIAGRRDRGLRGGLVSPPPARLRPRRSPGCAELHWAANAWVDGSVAFTEYGLAARARLKIHWSGKTSTFTARWRTTGPHARASVAVDGRSADPARPLGRCLSEAPGDVWSIFGGCDGICSTNRDGTDRMSTAVLDDAAGHEEGHR